MSSRDLRESFGKAAVSILGGTDPTRYSGALVALFG